MAITFTHATNMSLKRLSTIWGGDDEELVKYQKRHVSHLPSSSSLSSKDRFGGFHPYIITNRTGIKLKWSINQDKPVDFGESDVSYWDVDPKRALAQRQALSFFASNGEAIVRRLPIDGSRLICFKARIPDVGRPVSFVYDLRHELGSRVLDVRSNLMFLSAVKSENVSFVCMGETFTLEAGRSLVIPVHMSEEAIFVGGKSSNPPVSESFFKNSCEEMLEKKYSSNKILVATETKQYVLSVVGTSDRSSDIMTWEATVHPPLRLRNLLCVDMKVAVYEAKQKVLEFDIKRGEEQEIFKMASNQLQLSVGLVTGLGMMNMSNPIQLFEAGGIISCETPYSSLPLEVNLSNEMNGSARTVSFWTTFWILNKSSFSLATKDIPLLEGNSKEPIMYSGTTLNFTKMNKDVIVGAPTLKLAAVPDSATNTFTTSKHTYELGIRGFTAPSNFWRTQIIQVDN